jgi:capsular polysaccharide biosynthesis protein
VIDPSWSIDDPEPGEGVAVGDVQGGPVSLHFLLSALRRRWRLWVSCALVGMFLGGCYFALVPTKGEATVTLLLNHDPQTNPTSAMATDLSLLQTRRVATLVVDQLGLRMTPDEFLRTLTANAATDEVLVINVSGPSDAAAVARAQTLATGFLTFRNSQLLSQSRVLVDGYNQRIADFKAQADQLSQDYAALLAAGKSSQATDVLQQKGTISTYIQTLQQTAGDAALRMASAVETSAVIDDASAIPGSARKRLVLDLVSGLIGGAAVGMGVIVFLSVTSDKLWRREEVATALASPVRYSIGPVRRRRWVGRSRRADRSRNLEVLVHGLDQGLRATGGRIARLAVVSIDSVQEAELAVVALANTLQRRGLEVFLVDLSTSGQLGRAVTRTLATGRTDDSKPPVVFRPEGVPSLAQGPAGVSLGVLGEVPADDPLRDAWDTHNVVLTLAEVDPAVGAEHLSSWADQVVVIVAAGRASAERLRTTAELVRQAGLQILYGVLVRADGTDESLGKPITIDTGAGSTRASTTRQP